VLGPSGSGKTTLLILVLRFVTPYRVNRATNPAWAGMTTLRICAGIMLPLCKPVIAVFPPLSEQLVAGLAAGSLTE